MYGPKEIAASFRTVRKNTTQIARDIPENKYDFRPAPDTRSVAQTLVHIAISPMFQHHVMSNRIADLQMVNFAELVQKAGTEEATPRNKAELIALLEQDGEKFASFVEGLPEAFLAERVAMPPGAEEADKSRFEMLLGVKEHEMHHRGQLMTIERMIGIVPHLTKKMQDRIAQMQAAAQAAQPAQAQR